jgi:TusA-related sulfurtransferase
MKSALRIWIESIVDPNQRLQALCRLVEQLSKHPPLEVDGKDIAFVQETLLEPEPSAQVQERWLQIIEQLNASAKPQTDPNALRFRDLRGVVCPMNFVKTKLELARMEPGRRLEIWLDPGPPIENVPRSVVLEGHTILRREKAGDYWVVEIQKKQI